MPKENKIILQGITSFVIFIFLFGASFFAPKKHITNTLDTTYSLSKWKKLSQTASKKFTAGASKAVNGYLGLLASVESKTGIDEDKIETDLTALADAPKDKSIIVFSHPIPAESEITSPYGERVHPVTEEKSFHTGVDIGADTGTEVVAAADGTVADSGNDETYGNYAVIEHTGGYATVYAHLGSVFVKSGDSIKTGEKVGKIGSTGISTGPHLHFEIKYKGESVNPADYITGWKN